MRGMRASWQSLTGCIDAERFAEVSAFLDVQQREAKWWRDASIAYSQSASGRPLPRGISRPERSLNHYKSIKFTNVPGDPE